MSEKATRIKIQLQTVLIAGGVLSALLLAGQILFPATPELQPAKLLHRALNELKQTEEFTLVIQESSAGHELMFRGSVEDELVLRGALPDHDLEIYYAGKSVYARKAGTIKWAEAKELSSLAGFLFSPVSLLYHLNPNFDQAWAGEDILVGSLPCHTIYLDFTGDIELIKTLFPQIDTEAIEAVTLGAAFTKADLSINQLRVLVEFEENDLLERAYYINPNLRSDNPQTF